MPQSLQERLCTNWNWTSVALGALILAGVIGCSNPSSTPAEGTAAQRSASPKKDWRAEEFRKMVALGESTTAGGWASYRERSWAHQLARIINEFQRIPVQLVNVGIGANVISTRSPSYEHSGKPAAKRQW